MLQALKQNSLQSDAASTKQWTSIMCPRLLSSPILSMRLKKFSNCLSILTKFSQQPSSLIFVISSNVMRTIPSSFGSVQAILNGIFTRRLIKKLKPSIWLYPCKTSWDFSKKSKSDYILKVWKMTFQASDLKENQFLDLLVMERFGH